MSSDECYIVVHNLASGFDRYDLQSGELMSTYHVSVDPQRNVALPVLFIHGDKDLLLGDAAGMVRIVDIPANISQNLPHTGASS